MSVPFSSMRVLRGCGRVESSTRSTDMPRSSSIWALRSRSWVKVSFGEE